MDRRRTGGLEVNTDLIDDNQRDALVAELPSIDTEAPAEPRKAVKYEPHWNDDGTRVIWETVEVKEAPITIEKPETPLLNRAERRRLQRYIIRKARRQVRKVEQRQTREIRELRGKRCPRCNLLFIGRAKWRCQCKATLARKEKAMEASNATA
jgi:hypothetical protein